MINEINQLAQLGGTVATVGIFIFYLQKRDGVLDNYLKDSIKIKQELASKIQYFSDVAVGLKETTIQQSEVIKKMYEELVKKQWIIEVVRNGDQSERAKRIERVLKRTGSKIDNA